MRGRRRATLVLLNRAGFASLIMQADVLWGELWYQHAASDMRSGPQGQRQGPLEDGGGGRVWGASKRQLRMKKRSHTRMNNKTQLKLWKLTPVVISPRWPVKHYELQWEGGRFVCSDIVVKASYI